MIQLGPATGLLPRSDAPGRSVACAPDDVRCCRPRRVVGVLPSGTDINLLVISCGQRAGLKVGRTMYQRWAEL
jgi:hypothetical protein